MRMQESERRTAASRRLSDKVALLPEPLAETQYDLRHSPHHQFADGFPFLFQFRLEANRSHCAERRLQHAERKRYERALRAERRQRMSGARTADDLYAAASPFDFAGDDAHAQRDSLRIATSEQVMSHLVIAVQYAERKVAGAFHLNQRGHADAAGVGGVEAFDVVQSQPFSRQLIFGAVPLLDELAERPVRRARLAHLPDNGLPSRP